jgi:hypothetical protein
MHAHVLSRQRDFLDMLLDAHVSMSAQNRLPRHTRTAMTAYLVAAAEAAGPVGDGSWQEDALGRASEIVAGLCPTYNTSLRLALCRGAAHSNAMNLSLNNC